MSVLLIFIDGIGVGGRGAHNPLDGLDSPFLSFFQGEEPQLPYDGRWALTDARLGVEGLPQSATGQTTILTGVNGPQLIGRHLSGYPSPRLKQAIREHSVYRQLIARGKKVTFANAYTRAYFEKRPRFVSATTVAAESAGLRFRLIDDLARGEAVSHDFTNYFLIGMGYNVRSCTPEQSGANLARLAAAHDFTLYEHFITDRIGHSRDGDFAREHLANLARFVASAVANADLERQTILITSDHGNIEDLSTRTHTLNPVATVAFGPGRQVAAQRVRTLADITPAIIALLEA